MLSEEMQKKINSINLDIENIKKASFLMDEITKTMSFVSELESKKGE